MEDRLQDVRGEIGKFNAGLEVERQDRSKAIEDAHAAVIRHLDQIRTDLEATRTERLAHEVRYDEKFAVKFAGLDDILEREKEIRQEEWEITVQELKGAYKNLHEKEDVIERDISNFLEAEQLSLDVSLRIVFRWKLASNEPLSSKFIFYTVSIPTYFFPPGRRGSPRCLPGGYVGRVHEVFGLFAGKYRRRHRQRGQQKRKTQGIHRPSVGDRYAEERRGRRRISDPVVSAVAATIAGGIIAIGRIILSCCWTTLFTPLCIHSVPTFAVSRCSFLVRLLLRLTYLFRYVSHFRYYSLLLLGIRVYKTTYWSRSGSTHLPISLLCLYNYTANIRQPPRAFAHHKPGLCLKFS